MAMQEESVREVDEQRSKSGEFFHQPWWRGAGFPPNPNLGLDISSNSTKSEGLNVSGKEEADRSGLKNKDKAASQEHNEEQGHELNLHPPTTAEFLIPHSQLEHGHSVACTPYVYPESYYSGLLGAYTGPQSLVNSQLLGMPHHTRVLLPLEMAEEPVYVNAKQYHGILRRRQSRAKAELENKLIKVRKPYLHESRHQHAMRRARGCGGRFLNTKKADNTATLGSNPKETSSSSDRGRSMSPGPTSHSLSGGIHLAPFHSISDERGEEGDCSGRQRSSMTVDRAPKRVLTI